MKKTLFALTLIFLFGKNALVQAENPFSLSVEPRFSFSYGSLTEYLFDSGKNGRIRSRLDWDKRLFFYGIGTELSFFRAHLNLSFDMGIPRESGEMQDSDWMNESNPHMKTTYSVGANNALRNYAADIRFSFDFFPFNDKNARTFVLSPICGMQYSFDSFERTDAKGWYGQARLSSDGKYHWWYDDEALKIPYTRWSEEKNRMVTGKLAGIEYERSSLAVWLGARTDFKINSRLRLNCALFFSPYFYFESLDTHHGTEDSKYKESQHGSFSRFQCNLGADFKITERFTLASHFLVQSGKTPRGTVYKNGYKDTSVASGANSYEFRESISVKYKIF